MVVAASVLMACGGGGTASTAGTGGSAGTGGTGGSGGAGAGGASAGQGGAGGAASTESFYPYLPGSTWTFNYSQVGKADTTKVTTVDMTASPIGCQGSPATTVAYKYTTFIKGTGTMMKQDETVGWIGVTDAPGGGGTIHANYCQIDYKSGTTMESLQTRWDPFRLKADDSPAHTMMGATWMDHYDEYQLKAGTTVAVKTTQNDMYRIDAVNEMVTVPAGTFPCMKVAQANNGGAFDKFFYFSRGIGKVKEVANKTSEVLVSYKKGP